jgi:UTP--glucose-1-phosphate uridylyltransferase
MAITKAIFVVAGFGTRFLPATKAQPKEMLPIVDKPVIQYLVEESVEAGIENIIFVTGRGKTSIENHFDKSFELESTLVEKGKHKLVQEVEQISKLANFAYVRQPVQKGDGHALLCAKHFVDPTESVLIIFPDYLMPRQNRAIAKMMEVYREYHETVICLDRVEEEKVSGFGVVSYSNTNQDAVVKIDSFVEKPKREEAPSNLINTGYGIITPQVWKFLQNAESTAGDGEIRVADAYIAMLEAGKSIYGVVPQLPGYDCGSKIGFLKATVDMALEREDLRDEFWQFLAAKFK